MLIRFLVYNIYGMGGTVRTVNNMANALVQNGHDVEIISIMRSADKPLFNFDSKINFTIIFDARKEFNRKFVGTDEEKKAIKQKSKIINKDEEMYENFNAFIDKKLIKKLKSLKDGVLITTIPSFNMLAVEYVDDSVIKIGQEHKELSDHGKEIVKMIKNTYGKLDALTILTQHNYQVYRDCIDNKELPIVVLGNGTERMYSLSSLNSNVIISAGRFVDVKGFDLLIEAFSKLAEEFPDWIVKIFGRGELKDQLTQQILDANMENQIFLCPATEQLLMEVSKSAFYVCSSRHEGFGMIVIEAMSVGVPVVSYACEGPSEIINDGVEGLLVEQLNTDDLAEKMKILMLDYQKRKQMGRNAQISAEKYSTQAIAKQLENIISNAIERRKEKK